MPYIASKMALNFGEIEQPFNSYIKKGFGVGYGQKQVL